MKINVNFFKTSGKWYAGCVIDISEKNAVWSDEFKDEVARLQTAVSSTEGFRVVITHRDDYDADPSPYFCQCMYWG